MPPVTTFENVMTIRQARDFIERQFITERQTGRRRTPFVWGPPGQGKSAVVEQFAASLGSDWVMDHYRVSQCDPTDLKGIPYMFDMDGGKVSGYAPLKLFPIKLSPSSGEGKNRVIFLDEVPQATPVLMNLAANILDGVIGDVRVDPDRTFFVGAGNRPQDKSATFNMPFNVANRMCHITAKTSPDEWLEWGAENGIHPLVLAFIDRNPVTLNEVTAHNEMSFPTPRTWHAVSDDLTVHEAGWEKNPLARATTIGWVGTAAATQFFSFVKGYKQNEYLQKIITGKFPKPPAKQDDLYALTYEAAIAINRWADKAWLENKIGMIDIFDRNEAWVEGLGDKVQAINNIYEWFVKSGVDVAATVLLGKYQNKLVKDQLAFTILDDDRFEPAKEAYLVFNKQSLGQHS